MVTNRTMAAIKAGAICGILQGGMLALLQLTRAVPALNAISFLTPLTGVLSILFGLAAGALAMFMGRGYVRTLENSVVQGGMAGAIHAILVLLLTVGGVAVAALLAGTNAAAAISAWQAASMTGLITGMTMTFFYGMLGAVACAPLLLRIR